MLQSLALVLVIAPFFISFLLRTLAACVLALAGTAHADNLKVLTTGAFKQVVVALVPAFEARTGHKVEVQNDTAGALARRIMACSRSLAF